MASTNYQTYDIFSDQDPRKTVQMLSQNLQLQKRHLLEAESAYQGDSQKRKQFSSGEFNRAFKHLNHFTSNYLKMIVDSYVARLVIQGFNVGTGTKDAPDELAWKIFQANKLDHYAQLASRAAMVHGSVYLMVDPTTTVKGMPRITVETPFQVIGWQDPQDRSSNVAALKYWQAADGYIYANLFTTEDVLKFRSPQSFYRWDEAGLLTYLPIPQSISWNQIDEIHHGLGACPVITIENAPTLTRGGVSDLEALLPLQRGIDAVLKNALIASDYSAFPQKWAINVEQPKAADGSPLTTEAVEASLSRFWGFPPPGDKDTPEVKVGTFQATQMANYTAVLDELVHEMCMISSLPAYRLIGKLANLSASAILAAEAGFIDAIKVKQIDYATGWEKAMALALRVAGNEEGEESIETIWKDPSAVSGPNLAASLVLLDQIGVPQEILFRMTGAGPEEVETWMKKAEEQEAKAAESASEKEESGLKDQIVSNALNQLTANSSGNTNSNPNEDAEATAQNR